MVFTTALFWAASLALLSFQTVISEMNNIRMERMPTAIQVPINDFVFFDCEMNVAVTKFEWRHIPSRPNGSNKTVTLNHHLYKSNGFTSTTNFRVESERNVGGYQCIAWYGASAIASVPAQLTLAVLDEFPRNIPSETYTVSPGNTVAIHCPAPNSNPPASIEFYRNGELVELQTLRDTLVLKNVSTQDNGNYTCSARNYILEKTVRGNFQVTLNVMTTRKTAPRFLRTPLSNYTVKTGDYVVLKCSAVGTPPPSVRWQKLEGNGPHDRAELTPGGLKITKVKPSDQGTYMFEFINTIAPPLTAYIKLIVHEPPFILSGPVNTKVTEGDDLELECNVRGVPEPTISWVINSHSVTNDNHVKIIENRIYIKPVEKRHAGTIQCFATNSVGSVYEAASLTVFPKQISGGDGENLGTKPVTVGSEIRNHNHKQNHLSNKNGHKMLNVSAVMIPPSRPSVTRLSDDSVMVRWKVPDNSGLPIQFLKVQYRELSRPHDSNGSNNGTYGKVKNSRWMTLNADIAPHVKSYQVDNLTPDSWYRFRIAAVYSNNDNKLGPNSAKFHLQKEPFFTKNPLPMPEFMRTETVNETAIRIYWKCVNPPNVSVEGFYVYYRPVSSAGDYTKDTVDKENARSHIITYLQPGTAYEIKIQSYTAKAASDFSAKLIRDTLAPVTESSIAPETESPVMNNNGLGSKLYVIIVLGVVGAALLFGALPLLLVCKRYRKKKAQNNVSQDDGDHSDKCTPNDGSHHIQAEAKEYNMIGAKGSSTNRRKTQNQNGCLPSGQKMTITPNPLASADEDKNQNVMEMSSFLTSQNNNCSGSSEASSSQSDSGYVTTPAAVVRDLAHVKHGKGKASVAVDTVKGQKLNNTCEYQFVN